MKIAPVNINFQKMAVAFRKHVLAKALTANGTGKTTYYETAVTEKFIDPALSFVNVDLITRDLPGGYTSENFAKAGEITRRNIGGHIDAKNDFMPRN